MATGFLSTFAYYTNKTEKTTLHQSFKNRITQPLLGFLKQGVTPRKLALSVAFGLIFGLFPWVGTSTTLLLLVAVLFKINVVASQLVNYAVYPIQLLLIYPFVKLGLIFLPSLTSHDIPENLSLDFSIDFSGTFAWMGEVMVASVTGWLIVALPLFFVVYTIFFQIFNALDKPERERGLK